MARIVNCPYPDCESCHYPDCIMDEKQCLRIAAARKDNRDSGNFPTCRVCVHCVPVRSYNGREQVLYCWKASRLINGKVEISPTWCPLKESGKRIAALEKEEQEKAKRGTITDRAYKLSTYDLLVREGICTRCGKRPALPGIKMCADCRERFYATRRQKKLEREQAANGTI